jgi:broad specificity phosphatase PhoE
MSDLPDLYLMRHGETEWNRVGRLQGSFDAPLTVRGWRQAGWQADLVAGIAGLRLSSPQPRALRTAHRIFGTLGFGVDARLAAIGIGQFAGAVLQDLQRVHPRLFDGPPLAWYDRCPGGEGLLALAARCRRLLDSLNGPTLFVSHGITLRMLRLVALDLPLDQLAEGELRQGAVHLVRQGRSITLRHPLDHTYLGESPCQTGARGFSCTRRG